MSPAISRHLPDFSGDLAFNPGRGKEGLALLLRTPLRPAPPPPVDPAILLRAAEMRGRAQGRAEAQAEAAEALAEAQSDFDTLLVSARLQWCETEGDRLAAGLSTALEAVAAQLTDRLGRLVAPILTEALRREAMDALAAALRRLLDDPQHPPVRASGPADLLDALALKLGPLAGAVAFTPDDTIEVVVQADQTVIETQLAAWAGLVASAVEGA